MPVALGHTTRLTVTLIRRARCRRHQLERIIAAPVRQTYLALALCMDIPDSAWPEAVTNLLSSIYQTRHPLYTNRDQRKTYANSSKTTLPRDEGLLMVYFSIAFSLSKRKHNQYLVIAAQSVPVIIRMPARLDKSIELYLSFEGVSTQQRWHRAPS